MSAGNLQRSRRRIWLAGAAVVLTFSVASACQSSTAPPPPPETDDQRDPSQPTGPDQQGFLSLPDGIEGFLV